MAVQVGVPLSRSTTAGCLFVIVVAVALAVLGPGSAEKNEEFSAGGAFATRPARLCSFAFRAGYQLRL